MDYGMIRRRSPWDDQKKKSSLMGPFFPGLSSYHIIVLGALEGTALSRHNLCDLRS